MATKSNYYRCLLNRSDSDKISQPIRFLMRLKFLAGSGVGGMNWQQWSIVEIDPTLPIEPIIRSG